MMMNNKRSPTREERNLHLPIELRAADDGESKRIEGTAVEYNKHSLVMRDYWGDKFVEEFAVGAFDESLQARNQKGLWNHDTGKPLGSVAAGTMQIFTDSTGLRYMIDPPNNTWGADAVESIGRGDVDGSSFAFRALDDMWSIIELDGEEIYKRTILKADLYEVSPTTFPAYPDSQVGTREIKCRELVVNPDAEKRQRLELEIETILGGK